jgi:hypothetical protein
MKTEIKKITPPIAKSLLKKNNMNRVINEQRVNEYARLMTGGLWKEDTGESIKMSVDNSILDGQHRLLAVIKSGVSLNFLFVLELEKEIFTVLDTGVNRTSGDIFHIAGVSQSNNYAAIITKYIALKSGMTAVLREGPQRTAGLSIKSMKYSKAELFSIYSNKIKFWDGVVSNSDHWRNQFQRTMTLSEIGGLYAYFYDINHDSAFQFMDQLCSGVELNKTNPVRLLREKLIFSKMNLKFKLTPVQKLGLIYKTWNYFRKGESISVLRFSREIDNFPVAI